MAAGDGLKELKRHDVDAAVFRAAMELAWQYAKTGIESVKKGHTFVLGDVEKIGGFGFIKGGAKFDDFMSGARGFSILSQDDRSYILSQMNHDGMTVIRGDGVVWHNRFFSNGTSSKVKSGGARKASSAWLAEEADCIVLMVSEDSTGEVCVFKGSANYTEERPPLNSPNDRLVDDLLGMVDLEMLDPEQSPVARKRATTAYTDAWQDDGGAYAPTRELREWISSKRHKPRHHKAASALTLQDLLSLTTTGDTRKLGEQVMWELEGHLQTKVSASVALKYGPEDGISISTSQEMDSFLHELDATATLKAEACIEKHIIQAGTRINRVRVHQGNWSNVDSLETLRWHLRGNGIFPVFFEVDRPVRGIPPPKKERRALEKAIIKFGGDISQLVDLNRATLEVPSAEVAYRCVAEMRFISDSHSGPRLHLESMEDYLENPMPEGYRHLQCVLSIAGTLWELQIITAAMLQAKFIVGHRRYKTTRYVTEQVLLDAIRGNHSDLEELLAVKGVSAMANLMSATDSSGLTCLHHAAFRGDTRLVRLLLDHRANVDARTSGGQSPLMVALVHHRCDEIAINLLIERALNSQDVETLKEGLNAIKQIGPDISCHAQLVGPLLSSEHNAVRAAAVDLLGDLGSTATLSHAEMIAALLTDQDMHVRFAAVQFYGKLGCTAATPHFDAVTALLAHQDDLVRAAAWEALRKMEQDHCVASGGLDVAGKPATWAHIAAAANGGPDDVKMLAGCETDLLGEVGIAVMRVAVAMDNLEVVKFLVHVSLRNVGPSSTCHALLKFEEHVDCVQRLLTENPGLAHKFAEVRNECGQTAFESAAEECKNVIEQIVLSSPLLLGRYMLEHQVHESATCKVWFVLDHESEDGIDAAPLALKVMRERRLFQNEKMGRSWDAHSQRYILDVLEFYDGEAFEIEAERIPDISGYKYGLLMPRADRVLHDAILHEDLAGNPDMINTVRGLMQQLALALTYFHHHGHIHGDFNPRNAVRIGEAWRLIDLDASVRVKEPVGARLTDAYAPPEMLVMESGSVRRRDPTRRDVALLAEETFDIWSFGALLFHLVTGEPLFSVDAHGNLTSGGSLELVNWEWMHGPSFNERWEAALQSPKSCSHDFEQKAEYVLAKGLLRSLLQRDPAKRPQSVSEVLSDPFFTGAAHVSDLSFEKVAVGMTATPAEIQVEARFVEDLLRRVRRQGCVEFVRSELLGSARKGVALTGRHDLDVCLFIISPFEKFEDARAKFMTRLETALKVCDQAELVPQVSAKPLAHRVIVGGWLAVDLIAGCFETHEPQVNDIDACHLFMDNDSLRNGAMQLEAAHLRYLKEFPSRFQDKSIAFMPHYSAVSVMRLFERPEVVGQCVVLLKAWQCDRLQAEFIRRRDIERSKDTDIHRFDVALLGLDGCLLEHLAFNAHQKLKDTRLTQAPSLRELFQAALEVLKDARPGSQQTRVIMGARPVYNEGDFVKELEHLRLEAETAERPLVCWNPYNPYADMARKTELDQWKFAADGAAKTLLQLSGARDDSQRVEEVFSKRMLDHAARRLVQEEQTQVWASDELIMPSWHASVDVLMMGGKVCDFRVAPTMTTLEMKREIARITNTPPVLQQLTYKDTLLSNKERPFAHSERGVSSSLHLVRLARPDEPDYMDYANHVVWNWHWNDETGWDRTYVCSMYGCFSGEALVQMSDGSERPVKALSKGDVVAVPDDGCAEVVCLVRTRCLSGTRSLVKLGTRGLLITPDHPVRIGGRWFLPRELGGEPKTRPCEAVYSLLLSAGHVLIADGVEVVGLAHGFKEEKVAHPYWGSERVVEDLRRLNGFDTGLVDLSGVPAHTYSGSYASAS